MANKRWTQDETNLLISMGDNIEASGQSWREVGEMFGVSESSARQKYIREREKRGRKDRQTVKRDERVNTMVVEAQFAGIKTLDEMLEVCQVDLNVWKVDRYLVNKWPVGAKAAKKDLTWDEGRLTGSVYEDGLVIAPLFQVKVWLSRIEPEPIFPVLQPVECKIFKLPQAYKARKGELRRTLIFSDPHFGFIRDITTGELTPLHNRAVLDVILQVAQIAEVDRVDVLGDMLDLAEWSTKYTKSPEFCETTQPSVLEAHWWLSQFRQCCEEMTVYEGNHGKRLQDAIVTHLRAAYDLRPADEMEMPPAMSVPRLLGLDSLEIEWVGDYPSGEVWLNEFLRLTHGEIARIPGNTAKAVIESGDTNEIFGHTHKVEWGSRTIHRAKEIKQVVGFSPGCACWIDGRVPGFSSGPQWQNGCAIVDYEVGGELFWVSPVLICEDRAIFNKELIVARDQVSNLGSSYPDWKW